MIELKTTPEELLSLLAGYGRGWKNELESALAAHALVRAIEESFAECSKMEMSVGRRIQSNTLTFLEERTAELLAQWGMK